MVDRVLFDAQLAARAPGFAQAGEEQPEVVVNLGGGGDGGAGVAAGVFLLDGDGGGDAFDFVHVGLLNALEELPGVSGERLDVAPLAFGVDGVESERGLARARDAGDHGDGAVGDVEVDVFQVVDAGAAHADGILGFGERPGSVPRLRSG